MSLRPSETTSVARLTLAAATRFGVRVSRYVRRVVARVVFLVVLAICAGVAAQAAPVAEPSPTPRLPGAPKFPRKRPPTTPIPTPLPTADDPILLPFGLAWGDSPDTVTSILPRVKAVVKKKTPLGKSGEIWSIGGVPISGLRDARVLFQEQHVVGIDLEYGENAWPEEKYNNGMGNLRRRLEQMFVSPGLLVTRGPIKESSVEGIDQTLTGYEWKRFDTVVLLVYYSAEKKEGESVKNAFRSLLIRYRFRDPTLVAAESETTPAPSPAPPPGETSASPTPTPEPTPEAKGNELPLPKATNAEPLPE